MNTVRDKLFLNIERLQKIHYFCWRYRSKKSTTFVFGERSKTCFKTKSFQFSEELLCITFSRALQEFIFGRSILNLFMASVHLMKFLKFCFFFILFNSMNLNSICKSKIVQSQNRISRSEFSQFTNWLHTQQSQMVFLPNQFKRLDWLYREMKLEVSWKKMRMLSVKLLTFYDFFFFFNISTL